MTSFGPVTGNAATGVPQANASSCTTPNVSVRLGNTKTSAAARCAVRSAPFFSPRKIAPGYCLRELRLLRSVADDHFRSRQVERQKRFEILFDRDAAHRHEDRPRQIERHGIMRVEQFGIDAARPEAELAKTPRAEFLPQRIGRDHGRGRRGMKVPHHRIADAEREPGADRDIFGKARRIGRGKRELTAAAIGAHHPADRPFGRDMDGVRRGLLDPPRDLAPVRQRDAQARIGRQRHRGKAVRGEEADVGAKCQGAALASDVSVRTTPFTCGCHASVAINIFMFRTRDFVNDSQVRRSAMDISGV